MGFGRVGDIKDEKINYAMWRKTTAIAATATWWYDDSMLAGYPPANFYASEPLAAAVLDGNRGIRHWTAGHGGTEHVLASAVWGTGGTLEAPAQFVLCDYLMYYPFIDADSLDAQDLVNDITLPRYTDGVGVRAFMVTLGAGIQTGDYTLSYTNSDGVAGRISNGKVVTPVSIGSVCTTGGTVSPNGVGPFVPVQAGDKGIRSIEQVTWNTAPGGIVGLVLVKPLANFLYAEIGTMAETTYWPTLPKIESGAYLGLLRNPTGATPAGRVLNGMLTTVRS